MGSRSCWKWLPRLLRCPVTFLKGHLVLWSGRSWGEARVLRFSMLAVASAKVESSLGSLMRVAVVARKMLKEQLAPKMHWPSGGDVNICNSTHVHDRPL
eukprot:1959190-Amphidinium_carterae.1